MSRILKREYWNQGYWPDGLYTPPCDEAMIYDIQKMKDLGFNMIRKHIKIEPQRWYYHCDRIGMLVWQDMVNGGRDYKSWSCNVYGDGHGGNAYPGKRYQDSSDGTSGSGRAETV